MMRTITHTTLVLYSVSLLATLICRPLQADSTSRWYSSNQVEQGALLFRQHCAGCHGQNAESTIHWNQADASGQYPPPPLNGSAHAWHHDLSVLRKTIREGGQKLGGSMPPFKSVLNDEQIDSVIAFFQSFWTNEIYTKWAARFNVKASQPLKGPNTRYLQQRLGNMNIGSPVPTPMKGVYAIKFNEKWLYLTEDGEFAFIGEMIDLKNGINLSQ